MATEVSKGLSSKNWTRLNNLRKPSGQVLLAEKNVEMPFKSELFPVQLCNR